MTTRQKLEEAIDLSKLPIQDIRRCYQELRQIKPFEISGFGPSRPDQQNVTARRDITNGKILQRASSNFNQGKWLTRLGAMAANSAGGKVEVLEVGTCSGISAMYLLAGMASKNGGHLTTFEGSSELADLSSNNINQFITKNKLSNVNYDVIVGPLDDTFEPWVHSLETALGLAFIDGNHQEKPTIEYHNLIRTHMSRNGIVVHDDIDWSQGMKRAWQTIVKQESDHNIVEFNLGGRASRGLIFLGQKRSNHVEVINTDGLAERTARILKARLKSTG